LPELEKRLRRSVPWRERCLRILRRHPTAVYLGSLAALIAGISGAFLWEARAAGVTSPAALLFLGILALFPASELGTYLLQMFLTWFLPPRVLPKMSFEEGIPDDCRTLVVVPMMLLTPDAVRGAIERLEVRYFANPGANVSNMVLNPDGTIRSLGGYTVITSTTGTGREGIDERLFRLGLRITF